MKGVRNLKAGSRSSSDFGGFYARIHTAAFTKHVWRSLKTTSKQTGFR